MLALILSPFHSHASSLGGLDGITAVATVLENAGGLEDDGDANHENSDCAVCTLLTSVHVPDRDTASSPSINGEMRAVWLAPNLSLLPQSGGNAVFRPPIKLLA